ncbi:MAG: hypothetical protein RIS92_1848 [Verrucomicrobiota bacterium]
MINGEIFDAMNSVLKVLPPDGGAVVEGVDVHLIAAGSDSEDAALIGLADFDPLNEASGVISLPERGFIRVPDVACEFEGAMVAVLWGVQGEGKQARHHAFVGF